MNPVAMINLVSVMMILVVFIITIRIVRDIFFKIYVPFDRAQCKPLLVDLSAQNALELRGTPYIVKIIPFKAAYYQKDALYHVSKKIPQKHSLRSQICGFE